LTLAGNPIYAAPDPTPPFGQRPSQASISQSTGSNFVISNKFFNQFVGGPGGEYLELDSYNNVTITDCDFDSVPDALGSGRRCIYLVDCTGTIRIERCRARSVPQNFIQFNRSHMVGIIQDNRVRGATTNSEDLISFFRSGGVDANNRLLVYNNRLDGNIPSTLTPGYTSGSGTGIICCDSAQDLNTGFIDVVNCTCLNTAQVGIAVAGGNDITLIGNLVKGIQTATSNVGMYIRLGSSLVCQNITARGNRVFWINSSGSENDLFSPGTCGTVNNISDNVFGDPSLTIANLTVNLE